jgi:hypothetical protein
VLVGKFLEKVSHLQNLVLKFNNCLNLDGTEIIEMLASALSNKLKVLELELNNNNKTPSRKIIEILKGIAHYASLELLKLEFCLDHHATNRHNVMEEYSEMFLALGMAISLLRKLGKLHLLIKAFENISSDIWRKWVRRFLLMLKDNVNLKELNFYVTNSKVFLEHKGWKKIHQSLSSLPLLISFKHNILLTEYGQLY